MDIALSFMFNVPLGKCGKPEGLETEWTHRLLIWAELNGIKLNTESVLFTSKEAGVGTNIGKTGYIFIRVMSVLCCTAD
jgi:hypothetical protein